MPRASRKPVSKDIRDELVDNFSFLISSLSSPVDIQQYFDSFLTAEEKIMLTKRLMIHLMLKNGYDSKDISYVLGVSRETIRTHKAVWLAAGKKYVQIIDKISNRRKTIDFWKKVEKALKPLEYVLTAKSNMKSRAKFMNADFD